MDESSNPEKQPTGAVSVTIGGRRYRLRGDDADKLAKLATRVDETLGEIAGPEGQTEDFKVAVLAALNLAGEHEDLRERWHEMAVALSDDVRRLDRSLETLERRLAADDPPGGEPESTG